MERFKYYLCENKNNQYYIVRENVEWSKEDYYGGHGLFKDLIQHALFYEIKEEALEKIYECINYDRIYTEKSRRLIETD